MSKDAWEMRIYCRTGLWDRIWSDTREALEEQGRNITTLHGQRTWTCDLYAAGKYVAQCKAGEWKGVGP